MSVDQAVEHLLRVQDGMFTLLVERRQDRGRNQLTRIQARVLSAVKQRGHSTVSDIAELLDISAPTASQLVNTMVEREWLHRGAETSDRRRHLIEITETGVGVLAARDRQREQRFRRIVSQLSDDERVALVALAERIVLLWSTTSEPDQE